jgi:hypothetical protein
VPARAISISSPPSTARSKRERFIFASWTSLRGLVIGHQRLDDLLVSLVDRVGQPPGERRDLLGVVRLDEVLHNMNAQDLLVAHLDLDRAVQRAAGHAVRRRPANAARHLGWARELFEVHRRHEEDVLFPVYAERCRPPDNGSVRVLLADHERIAACFEVCDSAVGLALVDAIDDLAGALEHHDVRETRWFVPQVDTVLTHDERRAWIEPAAADLRRMPATPADQDEPPVDLQLPAPGPDRWRAEILLGRPFPLDDALATLPSDVFGDRARALLTDLPDDPVLVVRRVRRVGYVLSARSTRSPPG